MQLKDKVAIVTGAGSGMGEAIAKRFAQEGAKVIVSDMVQASIERVVQEITAAGGDAQPIICNVMIQEHVDNLMTAALDLYGQADILVNNAGIMDNFYPAADLSDELWDRVMAINLKGPFITTRAFLQQAIKSGRGGVIINNASVGGMFGARGGAAYVASKHGLIGLTKNTAAIYQDKGIRCVAMAPGGVNTNIGLTINAPHMEGMSKLGTGVGPAPMGEPEQIANVAVFLASDQASFISGTVVTVDGGWTAF